MGALDALEIIGRVTVVYVATAALLRFAGRREMSGLGPMDLLAMLLVSETVSPALTGGREGLGAGLLAAGTLFGLIGLTNYVMFHSRKLEAIIQGRPFVLIKNGKVDAEVMRKFRLTADDLDTSLHQQGLLAVGQVKRAFVEPDGCITIIKES